MERFSLASTTMQVTNFTSGKVRKLKRLLCERCNYVRCPSNVLCNFPSSKLFSALDEVSGNASLFLTYNIIHCTLQHTAISYMIHIAVYKYEVFNVSEKWSQKKCRGLLSTRPKPAYGRQGLDWDRWARIQFP